MLRHSHQPFDRIRAAREADGATPEAPETPEERGVRGAAGAGSSDERTTQQEGLGSPSVLVGIPAYNEADTIADVVATASAYADEVLVVDDGSGDDTRRVAEEAGATIVAHEGNRGYGASLRTIFQYAYVVDADHLVILDADGQHNADDIPNLVDEQRTTGSEITVGTRFSDASSTEIPLYRRFGLGVINLLTNAGLLIGYSQEPVSDTQCGFRAYDREAIETMARSSDIGSGMGASLDILFRAANEGYDVSEVPTTIDYEVDDSSTHNPVVHGLSVLKSLFLTVGRQRPVRTGLAMAGAALAVFGVAAVLAWTGANATHALFLVGIGIVLALGASLSGGRSTFHDLT